MNIENIFYLCIQKSVLAWSPCHTLSLCPTQPALILSIVIEFLEVVWFSSADGGRYNDTRHALSSVGFYLLHGFVGFFTWSFWKFSALAPLLKQIPILLGCSTSCDCCWLWLGSPINSCRSGVLCVLGNIACDSELVQMLFIYSDILWVLRFMP